jgi:transposase-like protein
MYFSTTPRPVIAHLADRLGVHREALRTWIRVEQGSMPRPKPVSGRGRAAVVPSQASGQLDVEEREELDALRLEVMELRRANEILKAASAFFAVQADPTRQWSSRSSKSSRRTSGSTLYSG